MKVMLFKVEVLIYMARFQLSWLKKKEEKKEEKRKKKRGRGRKEELDDF